MNANGAERQKLEVERSALARQIGRSLETPMMLLGLAWLTLLIIEFTRGLNRAGEIATTAIWIIFIAEFALRFFIAPRKGVFLRHHWLTAVSLLVPALRAFRLLRVLRIFRAARIARGLRLVKVIGSLNRGMRALGATMGRRGFGYITLLTLLVTLVGAAGMLAFENSPDGRGLNDYGTALWWTAMIMTTIGSDYWPQTMEGRLLCILLSLYALGILGYVAGVLATFFIGRDAESAQAEIAGERGITALREEIAGLRAEIRQFQKR